MDIVAGVDIGGTKTKIGLVTKDGDCLMDTWFRTKEYPDLDDYLDKMVDTIRSMVNDHPEDMNVLGIGIGAPNAKYSDEVDYSLNFHPKPVLTT